MFLRLKKNSDFKRLYSAGKKSYASGIMMIYSPSDKLKMGISVGKKYGNSVRRNRVKRLIRAAYTGLSKDIRKNYNIVFIPKTDFLHTFENINKSMVFLFKKEGFII